MDSQMDEPIVEGWKKRFAEETSIVDDTLVKIFSLDGTAVAFPINETTKAADFGVLWTALGPVDTLTRVDPNERIANVVARWTLQGKTTAKFITVASNTPRTEKTKNSGVRWELCWKNKGVVRYAGWLRMETTPSCFFTTLGLDEDRRFAVVAGHGRGHLIECTTSRRLLPGDLVDLTTSDLSIVVDDLKNCAIAIGKDPSTIAVTTKGDRIEFCVPNGKLAARCWRNELQRFSSFEEEEDIPTVVREERPRGRTCFEELERRCEDVVEKKFVYHQPVGRILREAEDISCALSTQGSRFEAAGVDVDVATMSLKSIVQDLKYGLQETTALLPTLFGAAEHPRVKAARGDAEVSARALAQACVDAAGRARRSVAVPKIFGFFFH